MTLPKTFLLKLALVIILAAFAGCGKSLPPAKSDASSESVGESSIQADSATNLNMSKPATEQSTHGKADAVRFATYNVSLYRKQAGQLIQDLADGTNAQAHKLATIVQQVRPDVLLLNEFDYDSENIAADSFRKHYLGQPHGDFDALDYPYCFSAASNTGTPSQVDFDNNGRNSDAADCYGYGTHPGQYGMLVLSKHPINTKQVRTFQMFLWKDMPDANLPVDPSTQSSYYSDEALSVFRLSSKSHWDVPIQIGESTIHFLVCHPTPPVFDGPEDRNGKRNHDEIRLFADYISPERSSYLVDDQGRIGGLESGAKFVIAGDLNADPNDGDSFEGAAKQLLQHPLVQSESTPASKGAAELGRDGVNANHGGDPAHDTADFDDRGTGNLRIDYVLPSRTLSVASGGVFWPVKDSPLHELIKATDHRMVWIDVTP